MQLSVPIPMQAAMVAKLDTKLEQQAATGQPIDDDKSDDSGDESSPSGLDGTCTAAGDLGAGGAPPQKRAKKQAAAVWEPAGRLPGSAAPGASQHMQVGIWQVVMAHTKHLDSMQRMPASEGLPNEAADAAA